MSRGLLPRAEGGLPWRYLALAIALHALVLSLSGERTHLPDAPLPGRIRLELRDSPLATSLPEVPSPRPQNQAVSRPHGIHPAPFPAAPLARDTPTAAPSGAELTASALAAIRAESRRLAADPMYRPPQPASETETPLQRATRPLPPGEKLLGEGVVRIVHPDGSVYCLQRPHEVANRDGPVAVVSIPMTCPIAF